jgi:hypothetical protein
MVTLLGYWVPPIVAVPTCETPASPSPNSLRNLMLSGGGGGAANSVVEDSDGAEVVGSLDGGSEVDGDVGSTEDPVLFVGLRGPDRPITCHAHATLPSTAAPTTVAMTPATIGCSITGRERSRSVIVGFPTYLGPIALRSDHDVRCLSTRQAFPPRPTRPTLLGLGLEAIDEGPAG